MPTLLAKSENALVLNIRTDPQKISIKLGATEVAEVYWPGARSAFITASRDSSETTSMFLGYRR